MDDTWFIDFINDKKRKLLDCQVEQMRLLREECGLPYKRLAEIFSVSKTIAFYICNQDKYRNKLNNDGKKFKRYYDKDRHNERKVKSRARMKLINSKFSPLKK